MPAASGLRLVRNAGLTLPALLARGPGSADIAETGRFHPVLAQAFTTGSNITDYTLTDFHIESNSAQIDDFSISSAGVLAFASSPNYKSPSHSNTNKVYTVMFEASTTDRTKGTPDVTVTVTDASKRPMKSGG